MTLSNNPSLAISEKPGLLKNFVRKIRVGTLSLLTGCQVVILINKAPSTATEPELPADSEATGEKPSSTVTEGASTGVNLPTEAMETNPEPPTDTGMSTTSFPSEGCGNGVLDEGEMCDYVDNLPQGLDQSSCIEETGIFKGTLQCNPDTCEYNLDLCTSLCGDGFISPGETCDDCNIEPGDGCNENCSLERCGNGEIDLFEACDDGNQIEDDGCTVNCTLSTCANGKLDEGEICDPKDDQDEPCQDNCTPPSSSCVIG